MGPLASFRFRVLHEALTRPFALGLTNVVLTEYEVSERTHDGRELVTRGIDVSEVRRGKVDAERNYLFDLEAEAALRRSPSDVGQSGQSGQPARSHACNHRERRGPAVAGGPSEELREAG